MDDTLNEPKAQETAQQAVETPENAETKPEIKPVDETVTVSKKKLSQLEMAANLTAKLQKRLERAEKRGNRMAVSQTPAFTFEQKEEEEESSQDQQVAAQQAERARFQSQLTAVVLDNPQYQKLLNENETLRRVLIRNPLSLLNPDNPPANAEDAIEQVTEYMDEKLSEGETETNPKQEEIPKPPQAANPPDTAIAPSEEKKEVKTSTRGNPMGKVADKIAEGIV